MSTNYTNEDYTKRVRARSTNTCDRDVIHTDSIHNMFVGWADYPGANPSDASMSVYVGDEDKRVYAIFAPKTYAIIITGTRIMNGSDETIMINSEVSDQSIGNIAHYRYEGQRTVDESTMDGCVGHVTFTDVGDDFVIKLWFNDVQNEVYGGVNDFIVYKNGMWYDDFNQYTKRCNVIVNGSDHVIDDDSFVDPPREGVDDGTGDVSLGMRLYGIDSNGTAWMSYKLPSELIYHNETCEPSLYFDCGQSLFLETIGNNTGGLVCDGMSSSCIDDYGMLIMSPELYGKANRSVDTVNTIIYTKRDAGKKVTFLRSGDVDHDRDLQLREYMINKAIRIPSHGYHGKTMLFQYPRNFASPLFYFDPKIIVAEYYHGMFKSKNIQKTDDALVTNILGDGITGSLSSSINSCIDYVFEYNIPINNTPFYKNYFVIFVNDNNGKMLDGLELGGYMNDSRSVMLHFIQEPRVKNRVYYCLHKPYFSEHKDFDDNYYERDEETENGWNYFFETCDSKIITAQSFTLFDTQSEGYIAYPRDDNFEYTVSFDDNSITPSVSDYQWGNRGYDIYSLERIDSITFTKRTT